MCSKKKLIKSAWCNNKRVKLWVLLLLWRLSTKRQKWGCVVHYNSSVRFPKFMAEYVITNTYLKLEFQVGKVEGTLSSQFIVAAVCRQWKLHSSPFIKQSACFLSRYYYLLRLTSGTQSRRTFCQLELECEAIPSSEFINSEVHTIANI